VFFDVRASMKSVARNKTCGKPRENA